LRKVSHCRFFIVWRTIGSGVQFAFGGTIAASRLSLYHSGGNVAMIGGASISYPKAAPFTYTLNTAIYNTTSSALYDAGASKVTGDVGSNVLTGLNLGVAHNNGNWLNGEIAEIIMYDKNVSGAERVAVEQYLRSKYAPPVSLGADTTLSNTLCPYTLSAQKDWFATYLWSTGASTPSIQVMQTGTYWVRVTDVFGYQSSDTIEINRPLYDSLKFAPKTRSICVGDSTRLSVGIPQSGFTFNWSNGANTNVLQAKAQGQYSVTVTDGFSCSVKSDTATVIVDSLAAIATLGNDTTLCAGNKIGLQKGVVSGLMYLWSNGTTQATLGVTAAGSYSVTVTSVNGCVLKDTISVSISGSAPLVNFEADTVCFGLPTHFVSSTTPAIVDSVFWEFGGGLNSKLQNPTIALPSFGVTSVKLTAFVNSCFASITKSVFVHEKPTAGIFSEDTFCVGGIASFNQADVVPSGQLAQSWWWDIANVGTFSTQNVSTTLPSVGGFLIKHKITTDKQCVDSVAKTVAVVQAGNSLVAVPSLIAPVENASYTSSIVSFVWNASENAKRYKLQISNDTLFQTLVLDSTIQNNNVVLAIPQSSNAYYWRIAAFNMCGDSVFSASRTFFVFSVNNVSNLKAWYRSDSLVSLSGSLVSQWGDASGNGLNAIQGITANRPSLVSSVPGINGKPVVKFDGVNDFLQVASFAQGQPLSVFIVWRTIGSGVQFAFGGTIAASRLSLYHSGGNVAMIGGASISYPKAAPFTYTLNTAIYNTTSSALYDAGASKVTGDVGSNVLTGLNLGVAHNNGNWLNGEIAEIIMYDKNVSGAERVAVEQYLRSKYAPPVSLGADTTLSNTLCPYTLSAQKDWFATYLWSTGASTPSIQVMQTGTYWVRVTDVFGYQSSDTIEINRPLYDSLKFAPKTRSICVGDSTRLSVGIPQSGFTFNWSNGANTNVLQAKAQGQYSVTVTDGFSCSVKSDTATVIVDSLAAIATLGNDTTLCAGNKIGLQKGVKPGLVYQWSTSATTPVVYVGQSGAYDVTVQSSSGCLYKDTVNVLIRGVVPVAVFRADSACFGSNTTFFNTSFATPPASLVSYLWEFGNNATSQNSNPVYVFPQAGEFAVKLSVYSSDTCSNDTLIKVRVYELPNTLFEVDTICTGKSIVFQDKTLIENLQSGFSWNWNFGDATFSSLQNPVKSYINAGSYTVSLKVITDKLCEDSFSKTVTAIPPQAAPDAFKSFLPVDNASFTFGSVLFQWNNSINATYYKLQVATASDFSTLVFDSLVYNSNLLLQMSGSLNAYWWRVAAYNRCGDSTVSNTRVFYVSHPTLTPNLKAWYKADSLVTLQSGLVSQWGDVSGNGFHAVQGTAASRPGLVASVTSLNKKPTLSFDGAGDFLQVASFVQGQPMSVFIVWRTIGSGVQFAFGGTIATNRLSLYHSGGNVAMLGGAGISYPKAAPFNYTLNSALFNSGVSALFDASIIKASGDLGNSTLTGLNIGVAHNSSNYLSGNIAEIIVYAKAVDSSERQNVERYLRTKYAPPVSLGPDIKILYGACDTTLRIKEHFVNVLWSTGDSNSYSLKVRQSGKYWVRTTDVFGFVTSDTVNVVVPYSGLAPVTDTIVCAGNNVAFNFGVSGAPYFFNWSTGDTTQSITVNQSGNYFVQVSDTIGCTLFSDTVNVSVDSLEFSSVLDDDTVACANASLGLNPYIYPYQFYQWSNGQNSDTIVVTGAGKFFVTVTDVNGCVAKDSINVSRLKGVVPIVNFGYKNVCLGDTTLFADSTAIVAPESVAIRQWSFGNNIPSDTAKNPLVVFPNTSMYPVSLYVETDSGCFNSKTMNLQIGARPSPFISYNVSCANSPVTLADASTIPLGDTVKFWNWDIDNGNLFSTKNVIYNFPSVGEFPVKLIVTSAKGCVDSVSVKVEVFPSINPDFTFANQCVGQSTIFTDATQSFSIIKRVWRLSDQFALINDSLSFKKVFASADTFEVTLEVTNAIGCVDTVTKPIVIYPLPVAQIVDTVACVGSSVTLTENSQSADSIIRYDWVFDSKQSKLRNPVFAVSDTGEIQMQLKVTTLQGCIDSVQNSFRVVAVPKAAFAYSPLFGESPLEVTFTNTSTNATNYLWNFGDGTGSSTDNNPVYTYHFNDTFSIKLTATNHLGCADSMSRDIVVIPTDADIQLLTINTQNNQLLNGALSANVIARFANVGTQPIVNAQFLARLDDGTTILDDWQGLLYPGDQLLHTFSSAFYLPKSSVVQYVCVDAVNVNNGAEKKLENNKNCRSLSNQSVITNLYPNPASGEIFLDLILPDETEFSFEVSNEMGQKMIPKFDYKGVRGINTVSFDVRSFRPGVYFLRIKYRDNTEVQKFQVIR
jgi:PKD repeat protein